MDTISMVVITFAFGIVLGVALSLKRQNDERGRKLAETARLLGLYTTLFGGRVAVDTSLLERVSFSRVGYSEENHQYIMNASQNEDMTGTYLELKGKNLKGMAEAVTAAINERIVIPQSNVSKPKIVHIK